jgi:hypothetical protein
LLSEIIFPSCLEIPLCKQPQILKYGAGGWTPFGTDIQNLGEFFIRRWSFRGVADEHQVGSQRSGSTSVKTDPLSHHRWPARSGPSISGGTTNEAYLISPILSQPSPSHSNHRDRDNLFPFNLKFKSKSLAESASQPTQAPNFVSFYFPPFPFSFFFRMEFHISGGTGCLSVVGSRINPTNIMINTWHKTLGMVTTPCRKFESFWVRPAASFRILPCKPCSKSKASPSISFSSLYFLGWAQS